MPRWQRRERGGQVCCVFPPWLADPIGIEIFCPSVWLQFSHPRKREFLFFTWSVANHKQWYRFSNWYSINKLISREYINIEFKFFSRSNCRIFSWGQQISKKSIRISSSLQYTFVPSSKLVSIDHCCLFLVAPRREASFQEHTFTAVDSFQSLPESKQRR